MVEYFFSFSKFLLEPKILEKMQWTLIPRRIVSYKFLYSVGFVKEAWVWQRPICVSAEATFFTLIVQVRINTISIWEIIPDRKELACLIRNICQALIIGKSFSAEPQNLNSHNETDLMSLLFYNNINYNPVTEGSQLEIKKVKCARIGLHSASFPQIQIGLESHTYVSSKWMNLTLALSCLEEMHIESVLNLGFSF